jgi:gamma-glutamyltranspeptidase/glutathione hydrolase
LASAAGYDVLKRGGNAFDAAVATSFALAVTFHPAGGLGGDFFGMFYEAKTGKVHCLNSSGWAPSGLTLDLVAPKGRIPRFGPFTCMVPGMVAGVWEMHRKLGSLDFRSLLSAPVSLAEGFPAGEEICRSTAGAFDELPVEAKAIFAPSGVPPNPGEWIRQERLGQVIADIQSGGPEAFYSGWPAEKTCELLNSLGVPATSEDFKDFKPEWVSPITLDYRGTVVYEMPPNTMGATALLILKLLSAEHLGGGPLSKERIAAVMRAVPPAYARRDEALGDPRFAPFSLDKFLQVKVAYASTSSAINPGDTTAFSIADADGNIVSGIQSLFNHFGSRVFVPECGIFLNNRGAGFATSGPNMAEPRKRPLHTLSSMILQRDERPRIAIGASGGDFRPQQHALFVANLVDYDMPLEGAVDHPRFLWAGGGELLVEAGYEEFDSEFKVRQLPMPGPTGVCQAVEIEGRTRKAVCDVRGYGIPAGF